MRYQEIVRSSVPLLEFQTYSKLHRYVLNAYIRDGNNVLANSPNAQLLSTDDPRVTLKVITTDIDELTIYIMLDEKSVGYIKFEKSDYAKHLEDIVPCKALTPHIMLDKVLHGKGYAGYFYQKALDDGYTLVTSSHSRDAEALWKRMAEKNNITIQYVDLDNGYEVFPDNMGVQALKNDDIVKLMKKGGLILPQKPVKENIEPLAEFKKFSRLDRRAVSSGIDLGNNASGKKHKTENQRVQYKIEKDSTEMTVYFYLDGKSSGYICFQDAWPMNEMDVLYPNDKFLTPHATLSPEMRGKGYTDYFYQKALDAGYTLMTISHSNNASQLWERLAKKNKTKIQYFDSKEGWETGPSNKGHVVKVLKKGGLKSI